MARRRADTWGIHVHFGTIHSPEVDQKVKSLYLPAADGDPPLILVSDHLDIPGRLMALEVGLAHFYLNHRRQPERSRWDRQQRQALQHVLARQIPLYQLVRMDIRGWSPGRLAVELGVPGWAVQWRIEHPDPWEARLVTLGLTG